MVTVGLRGGRVVEVCVSCGRFAPFEVDIRHDWDCEV
jgi:hypothetical protein